MTARQLGDEARSLAGFVQRAAGYAGYGAPNAGVRLAAQNRFRDESPVD